MELARGFVGMGEGQSKNNKCLVNYIRHLPFKARHQLLTTIDTRAIGVKYGRQQKCSQTVIALFSSGSSAEAS